MSVETTPPMPVSVVTDYPGATEAQYDALARELGYAPDAATPDGLLFHWGVEAHGGVRTVDVWIGRAQFDTYNEALLLPAAARVGLSAEPKVAFIPVRNYAG